MRSLRLGLAMLLLVAVAGSAFGDDGAAELTAGFQNGRFWRDAPESLQFGFIIGIMHTRNWDRNVLRLVKSTPNPLESSSLDSVYSSMVLGEIRESLNTFYAVPSRRAIPVIHALYLIGGQIADGQTEEQFESSVAAAIKLWTDPPDSQP